MGQTVDNDGEIEKIKDKINNVLKTSKEAQEYRNF